MISRAGPPHGNALGFLRLVLASLVIISHSGELLTPVQDDAFTRLFGHHVSFGAFAVDGFFVLSGYLITQSFMQRRSVLAYLKARVRRIYPGFLAAFAVAALLGLFEGGALPLHKAIILPLHAVLLEQPIVPGALQGMQIPALNGSVWTIAYEFRCYLLVVALGLLGCFRHRWAMAVLTAALFAAFIALKLGVYSAPPFQAGSPLGALEPTLRLTGLFAAGSCFLLYGVRFNGWVALACLVPLAASQLSPVSADLGVALFGGYALFWFGFNMKARWALTINNKDDISYGVYLYGWPVTSALIWFGVRDPAAVTLASLALAGLLGAGSWFWVENPLRKSRTRRAAASPAPV
jgi:peptidoglycan/LPS O-acetylase OafA/YrhL